MLIEAKSQLAKLMATENITIQQRNTQTAYFHLTNRVLTLPVFDGNIDANLYDLLVGHEIGHALYTPSEGWHDAILDLKIPRSILNVVEDVRIEKLVKRKYPGIRKSFLSAYNQLFNEKDFFGTKDKNLNAFNFIDRLNIYMKCGASTGITFSEKELELVNEIEKLETWQDVKVVSQKIFSYMKEQVVKDKELSGSKNDNEMTGTDFDSSHENSSADFDENDENDENASGNDIKSFTDESFREREKELYVSDETVIDYVDIPDVDSSQVINPYQKLYACIDQWYIDMFGNGDTKNDEQIFKYQTSYETEKFNIFKNSTKNVVNYLVKEFELRKNAEENKRASVAKTGTLNLSKIYSYKFNDDLFKKVCIVPGGKSHGLVMFLDWSGSMVNYAHDTMKQVINLVMFCQKVNIPFEVYLFSDLPTKEFKNIDNLSPTAYLKNPKPGQFIIENKSFILHNIFSSKMSAPELNKAFRVMFYISTNASFRPHFLDLNSTPLNETILSAMDIIPKFQKQNNLQNVNAVFLTDGEGNIMNRILSDTNSSQIVYGIILNLSSNKVIVRDNMTKAMCVLNKQNEKATELSKALLFHLKNRTNCNIVGFYITDRYGYRNKTRNMQKNDQSKNDHSVIVSQGYDEYYIIKSNSMKIDNFENFETNKDTFRGIVSDFKKFSSKKLTNRVVLNRFIELIK